MIIFNNQSKNSLDDEIEILMNSEFFKNYGNLKY